ncbi:nucleotidyltransferase family protein [Paraglaciecola sp. 2405UD69-4]|uniref:nucleotidyltransferase family protein n=1 Tax=Paraglaciecola sp. 2405UD69-4 TaxID=3391836 RepID=UPI0039C9267F
MKIELLLLAAGQSKRFSGIKQLADIYGHAMVCHSLLSYQQQGQWLDGIDNTVVVLGANAHAIKKTLADKVTTHIVKSWAQGMGSSLSESMEVLSPETTHLMVGLADQVAIKPESIKAFVAQSFQYPHKIIAAQYQGKVGAPAIFPKSYFPLLRQLQGDRGAKSILLNNLEQIIKVAMPSASIDIDTQADLLEFLGKQ